MTGPCPCSECVLAGCDRPPVRISSGFRNPPRELHGRELQRHYAAQDAHKASLRLMVDKLLAKAKEAHR